MVFVYARDLSEVGLIQHGLFKLLEDEVRTNPSLLERSTDWVGSTSPLSASSV